MRSDQKAVGVAPDPLSFTRRLDGEEVQALSTRPSAVIANVVTLVAGLLLDGFVLACNEPIPPPCIGFPVAWPALLPVALLTLVLAFAAVGLSGRSRSRWVRLLIVVAFAGGVTSWVLGLRAAVVLG
ncbi:hypothetical protein ASF48_08175 [Rathayibacter sp. Leaf299]|uniref:hypothetical protein n=1 Tax=Rathayibacter sp. Leaf299 TaxID=1736328 RepID=UPI000700D575|nr:hypothetical protein [Rathayibacter sp. Leaf299]KQQ20592.1 hypothetical protein ASF48_08175 [Rathayibacter sp. Leaf299]